MSDREPAAWLAPVVGAFAFVAGAWGLWCTVVGFMGGTMPLIGVHTDGGLFVGVFMLFIGEPILLTVAYWASMLVLMPLALVASRPSSRKGVASGGGTNPAASGSRGGWLHQPCVVKARPMARWPYSGPAELTTYWGEIEVLPKSELTHLDAVRVPITSRSLWARIEEDPTDWGLDGIDPTKPVFAVMDEDLGVRIYVQQCGEGPGPREWLKVFEGYGIGSVPPGWPTAVRPKVE